MHSALKSPISKHRLHEIIGSGPAAIHSVLARFNLCTKPATYIHRHAPNSYFGLGFPITVGN